MEENSLPLHLCHAPKLPIFINRLHTITHSTALLFLLHYRTSFLLNPHDQSKPTPLLPWLLLFSSELILSFIWLLGQSYRWHPVSRIAFPERLPDNDYLPSIDVFICTADPIKEPVEKVMNTLISAIALDYPPQKLHVYLSDDAGSPITLYGMKMAKDFAKSWIPFCRKYMIMDICPEAYFSGLDSENVDSSICDRFRTDRLEIKEKFEEFKDSLSKVRDKVPSNSRDHPAVIEVIGENVNDDLPLLVYVAREKRPSCPHHFKAGALNVLHRVSSVISNSPYLLMLDCDMYCNDPSSARKAMCFHLDSKITSSLAFVQFPQKFQHISKNDIYDSQLRSGYQVQWPGMDGLKGPVLSGTGFYIKRACLCGSSKPDDVDPIQLRESMGLSNEFVKSLNRNYCPNKSFNDETLVKETQILASSSYENGTKWGKGVGFLYNSVSEDFLTGLLLHCKGWISVYCDPPRPQFLGTGITNLNDLLNQGTRWSSGLVEVGISEFCPLTYAPLRMSFLQSMAYAELSFFPFYFIPLWCFATIPQLCLLNGIPLYPDFSNSYFILISTIFLSASFKHLQEVIMTNGSIQTWINEQRLWMIKSITFHLYGSFDAFIKRIGMRDINFLPTSKVDDEEELKRYQMGIYDFRISNMFLIPMVSLIILNMVSFGVGVVQVMVNGSWKKMFVQIVLSFYILWINYPIIEAMFMRKDKGSISSRVTLLAAIFSLLFLYLGSTILVYVA